MLVAPRAPRLSAILAVLVMVVPGVLVVAPAALLAVSPVASATHDSAAVLGGPDLNVTAFSVGTEAQKNATFVSSGQDLFATVTIRNDGLGSATNVPVVVVAVPREGTGSLDLVRACSLVSLGATGTADATKTVSVRFVIPPPAPTATDADKTFQVRVRANHWDPAELGTTAIPVPGTNVQCRHENGNGVRDAGEPMAEAGRQLSTVQHLQNNRPRAGDFVPKDRVVIADLRLDLDVTGFRVCGGWMPEATGRDQCNTNVKVARTGSEAEKAAHQHVTNAEYNSPDYENEGPGSGSGASEPRYFWFRAFVKNVASFTRMTNPNTGEPWEVRLNITATNESYTSVVLRNGDPVNRRDMKSDPVFKLNALDDGLAIGLNKTEPNRKGETGCNLTPPNCNSLGQFRRFNLTNRAGDYNFTIAATPVEEDNAYASKTAREFAHPEAGVAGNTESVDPVHVRAPDLAGWINRDPTATGGLKPLSTPYTFDASFKREFPLNVRVTNLGDFRARNVTDGASTPILWRLYLDRVQAYDEETGGYVAGSEPVNPPASIAEGANLSHTFTVRAYDGTALDESPGDGWINVTPGRHKFILVVDPRSTGDTYLGSNPCAAHDETCRTDGRIYELDESNNTDMAEFRFEDKKAPEVKDFEARWLRGAVDPAGPPVVLRRPDDSSSTVDMRVNRSEKITWSINATDDDEGMTAKLTVIAPNQTVPTGPKTWYNFTAKRGNWDGIHGADTWHVNTTLKDVGVNTVFFNATDSGGNHGLSKTFQLDVKNWDIMTKRPSQILHQEVANGTVIPWVAGGDTWWRIAVWKNDTGVLPEWTPDNKQLLVKYPGTDSFVLRANGFESIGESVCTDTEPVQLPPPAPVQPEQTPCVNAHVFDEYLEWENEVGAWEIKIRITDLSGSVREIQRHFTVSGDGPLIKKVRELKDETVLAGRRLPTVWMNASDEFGIEKMGIEFKSRVNTSWVANLTLVNQTYEGQEGEAKAINSSVNISTGLFRALNQSGEHTVTYWVRNVNGEYARKVTSFNLTDAQAPVIVASASSVRPNPQEVLQPVTFRVRATDESAFVVKLKITKGSTVYEDRHLTRIGTTPNFTFERTFTEPGDYTYVMQAVDSTNQVSGKFEGLLAIADNLAPRFTILSPDYVNDRGRFGSATPTFQIRIEDKDGIHENSVTLTAKIVRSNGATETLALTPLIIEPSTDPKGVVVKASLAADAARLTHNTTVQLEASAKDTSPKNLTGNLTGADGRFRVDALPPESKVPLFKGAQYRALDTDRLNVSLETEIELRAEEPKDSAQTEVRTIAYTVLRPETGTSRARTYGPFPISPGETFTFDDLFTSRKVENLGSGPYRIQFVATDAVGNREAVAKHYDLVLDALKPYPDVLATLPRGRHVNATWIDPHPSSGIASAVAWYTINRGLPKSIALTEVGGQWSGVIEEGKRGENLCYYLQAWDNVGNTETYRNATNPFCFPIGNQVPVIDLTEPGEGARLKGVTTLRWTASDPDGDSLTYKVFARLNGRQDPTEIATLAAGADRYALDTTKLADGVYELQVTTTDGNFISFDKVKVTVANRATAIDEPSVSKSVVRPGEKLLVTAVITKAGATVEARIYKGERLVTSVAMRDDGREGDKVAGDSIYSAEVVLEDGGDYSVEIVANYREDGVDKSDTLSDAAKFTVKLTPGDVLSKFRALWIAVVALVVACAAVGGYALTRKWRKEG